MDFGLLKRLTETPGISGREERVRDLVAEEFSGLSHEEVTIDALGNLIARTSSWELFFSPKLMRFSVAIKFGLSLTLPR